jgi:hypothetical protein
MSALQVVALQLGGVAIGETGVQEVAAFALVHMLECVIPEATGERGVFSVDLHVDEPPASRTLRRCLSFISSSWCVSVMQQGCFRCAHIRLS